MPVTSREPHDTQNLMLQIQLQALFKRWNRGLQRTFNIPDILPFKGHSLERLRSPNKEFHIDSPFLFESALTGAWESFRKNSLN